MAAHPLARVAVRRDKIAAAIRTAWSAPGDGESLARVVEAVLEKLPKKTPYSSVYKSLNQLVGPSPPSDKLIRDMSWALAANRAALRAGKPVWPPVIPTKSEPVTMQFVAAARLPDRKGSKDIGFPVLYRVRILQGSGAPLEIDTRMSSRFVHYLAVRPQGLGFAKPPRGDRLPSGRPYQHYETLVGMLVRADLQVDPDGKTKIDNYRCSSSMMAYNRALIEMRWRSTFVCPFGFEHACHQCPKGQQSCKIATHPMDYEKRMCPQCMTDSEFDPYWGGTVCRKCSLKPRRS